MEHKYSGAAGECKQCLTIPPKMSKDLSSSKKIDLPQASFPGSLLALTNLFFARARGEPGNEANLPPTMPQLPSATHPTPPSLHPQHTSHVTVCLVIKAPTQMTITTTSNSYLPREVGGCPYMNLS